MVMPMTPAAAVSRTTDAPQPRVRIVKRPVKKSEMWCRPNWEAVWEVQVWKRGFFGLLGPRWVVHDDYAGPTSAADAAVSLLHPKVHTAFEPVVVKEYL